MDVDTGIGAGLGWPQYLIEAWGITGLALFIMLLRYCVRVRTVGFRGLQGDDAMVLFTIAFTILDASTVTVAYHKGQNIEITEADVPNLTDADIHRLTVGSKYELTAWYSYVSLIYTLKFTMLFFYRRITFNSWHALMVKYLFWITGAAYVANMFVVTFGCYPVEKNWQVVPIAPWQCSFRTHNFIGTAVLNILTDALLLAIPLPMLYKLNVPLKKKFVIGLVLSSGLFVIAAAIIRLVLSLDATPSAANINAWGIRETVIAVFTVNIPILRPLFSSAFWKLGPYSPTGNHNSSGYSKSAGASRQIGTHRSKGTRMMQSQLGEYNKDDDLEMGHRVGVTGGPSPPSSSGQDIEGGAKKGGAFGGIIQTRVVELTETDEENLIQPGDDSRPAHN